MLSGAGDAGFGGYDGRSRRVCAPLGKAFFVEACGAIDSLASDRTSADTHLAGKNKKVAVVHVQSE